MTLGSIRRKILETPSRWGQTTSDALGSSRVPMALLGPCWNTKEGFPGSRPASGPCSGARGSAVELVDFHHAAPGLAGVRPEPAHHRSSRLLHLQLEGPGRG